MAADSKDTLVAGPRSKRRAPEVPPPAADDKLAPGHEVGDYVVEGVLGEGGFGTVYDARHTLIGKRAAVKLLALKHCVDPGVVARFLEEARAVNRIRHPDIIDIFGFGQLDDGRHYYVMERLEGQTLAERLERAGRLSPEEVLRILGHVARALDAAHAAGVAHRDIKPENIFLQDVDGVIRPKLLDFGIAKLQRDDEPEHHTETGATIGTPSYMSPEQCVGKGVDYRSDIYAIGVLAFELLTGRPPFVEESRFLLMAAHVNEPVPDPRAIVPELPLKTHAALAAIMAKDAGDRPPTVQAAVDLLADALGAVDVATRDRPRRGRAVALAVVGTAAVLAAGLYLGSLLFERPQVESLESAQGRDRVEGPLVAVPPENGEDLEEVEAAQNALGAGDVERQVKPQDVTAAGVAEKNDETPAPAQPDGQRAQGSSSGGTPERDCATRRPPARGEGGKHDRPSSPSTSDEKKRGLDDLEPW